MIDVIRRTAMISTERDERTDENNSQNTGSVPISWENLWEFRGRYEKEGLPLGFALNPELFHTGFERRGIESEDSGRAFVAADAPVGLL